MIKIFLLIIFASLSIYCFIPSIWFRCFSKKTIKSTEENSVAITFDDGPSEITKGVLQILRDANTKVTFFILGTSAKEHEDAIKQEIKDGHQIGLHGMNHKCHWFLGPKATFQDVRESKKIIAEMGGNPIFFRPPWGLYNLCTVIACKQEKLRWVHWSIHTYDWRKSISAKQREEIIANKIKAGDILLIHDGRGDEGAKEVTAKALPNIISIIGKKDLHTVIL